MSYNTSAMGDVVGMDIEYSHGRVRPSINEFELSDDGYDLLIPADGGEDFYAGSGESSDFDFYNAGGYDTDDYLPDDMSKGAEDYYGSDGDEEYSNLTLWSKKKRRKFADKVGKAGKKAGDLIKQATGLAQGIVPKSSGGAPMPAVAPPPSSPPPAKGLTTGVKVAIGVGVVVVGVLAWYLMKKKN